MVGVLEDGTQFSLLHPCNPGLLLGWVVDPGPNPPEELARIRSKSVFELGPGQSREFEMGEDWGCSGSSWKPIPTPGEYTLEYRIHPWDTKRKPAIDLPSKAGIGERMAAARAALGSDQFWEGAYRSEAVRVKFTRPKVKHLDY